MAADPNSHMHAVIRDSAPDLVETHQFLHEALPAPDVFDVAIDLADPHGLIHGFPKLTSAVINDVTCSHAIWQQQEGEAQPRFGGAYLVRRYRWSGVELGILRLAEHEAVLLRRRGTRVTDVWYDGKHIGGLDRPHWWSRVGLMRSGTIIGSIRTPMWGIALKGTKDFVVKMTLHDDRVLHVIMDHKYPNDAMVGVGGAMGALGEAMAKGLYRHDWFPGPQPPAGLTPIFSASELEVLWSEPPEHRLLIAISAIWLISYIPR